MKWVLLAVGVVVVVGFADLPQITALRDIADGDRVRFVWPGGPGLPGGAVGGDFGDAKPPVARRVGRVHGGGELDESRDEGVGTAAGLV